MSARFLGVVCALVCAATTVPASAQSSAGELYIRGDAGWSGAMNANIHDRNFTVDRAIMGPAGSAGALSDIGSGWLVGGGLGMQFIPNFRGDIVYTYRGGYRLDQFDQAPSPTKFRADLSSNSVMANAYGDFPFGYPGIIPFVGFGIGWSGVNMSNFSATHSGTTTIAPGGTSNNFAWQVTGGVGFAVSDGIMVDLFYRYFDGGHVQSNSGNVTSGGSVVGTYHGAEGALHANEVGLSVRFPIH